MNDIDIPRTVEECRQKLREEFVKHKDVKDIRVIDMLIVKVSRHLIFMKEEDYFQIVLCVLTVCCYLLLGSNGAARNGNPMETSWPCYGILERYR